MVKKKSAAWVPLSIMTVLVCTGYCAAFFLLNAEKDRISWLWFGAALLYFFLTFFSFLHMRRNSPEPSRAALNSCFCLIYAVVSILLTVPNRPFRDLTFEQSLTVCLFISVIYLIFRFLLWKKNRNQTVRVQNPIRQADGFIRSLNTELTALKQEAEDSGLKAAVEQLREDVQYSEPGGRADTSELDERILGNMDMLREDLEEQKTDRALERVKKLRQLIARRNALVREGNRS